MSGYTLHEAQDGVWDESLIECDELPVPDIEFEPHLLISKVRKYYMDYIIKVLSVNYENNQRLINKNIRLPSAIWRLAKNIEMSAAHTCMVVQLYRRNIVPVIKEVKKNTKNGKMYRKLFDYVNKPPENEKKIQTSLGDSNDCTCQCDCKKIKKRRRSSASSKECETNSVTSTTSNINNNTLTKDNNSSSGIPPQSIVENNNITSTQLYSEPPSKSVETQETDLLLKQLEMLFQGDCNDDDLFAEHSQYNNPVSSIISSSLNEANANITQREHITKTVDIGDQNMPIEHSQNQSFNEKIASFAGQLVNVNDNTSRPCTQKARRSVSSKWLCEEYFLKAKLFEIIDELRDCNRAKLARIKTIWTDLFGDDSDDEGVVSPLDETQEFITSCKERIAPWVVRMLTPFYIKNRIKGKTLFKSVAKHLIRLIYQCNKYPSEYDVKIFVSEFLESHKIIRCEADFKQFRRDNISQQFEDF